MSPLNIFPVPDFPSTIPAIDTNGQDIMDFLIQNYIQKNPGLAHLYERFPINTLVFAYEYQLCKERATDKSNITVYYPGIGGGDQPIDPLGAFWGTDADTVYGVDLLDGREDIKDFNLWGKPRLEREASNIVIDDTDPLIWKATFDYNGRPRTLIISKVPTDAEKEVVDYPGLNIGELTYSTGTATMLNRLAGPMQERVRILMVADDNEFTPMQVREYWQGLGFQHFDYAVLGTFFKSKYGLEGNPPRSTHGYTLVK